MTDKTAEQLIAEHNQIEDWLKGETKRFNKFMAPHKARLEEIGNKLLALSNEQKWESIRTDAGTAYRSTLMNSSIDAEKPYSNKDGVIVFGREAVLDFCLENWSDYGSDMLMVQAQKDAIKRYMEEHSGEPPPGIKVGFFTRINIRRS